MPDSMITQATSGAPAQATDCIPIGRPGLGAPRKLTISEVLELSARPSLLINGALQVWQRGTTFAVTSARAYSADRWICVGMSNVTASRQPGDAGQYCLRVQRAAGDVGTSQISTIQMVESCNIIPFQGQTVVASFRARKGADYSASGANISAVLNTGTGIDESNNFTYTGRVVTSTPNVLTADWQRFQATLQIPVDATELAFYLAFTPTGTAGVGDYFEVEEVALVPRAFAGFPYRSYAHEIALCRRYYERIGNTGSRTNLAPIAYSSATAGHGVVNFEVQKRVAPTVTFNGAWRTLGHLHGTAVTVAASEIGTNFMAITGTTAGATAGMASLVQSSDALTAYVDVSAEI